MTIENAQHVEFGLVAKGESYKVLLLLNYGWTMDCGVKLHQPWKLLNVIDTKF